MKKLFVSRLGAALILLACRSLHAQSTNVYWDFTAGATPASGLITGLTPPTLTSSATLTFSATSASSGYTTAAGFAASGGNSAAVRAITGAFDTGISTYLAFSLSLSLAAGGSDEITDISFGSRQTGTGPTTLSLYKSTDGFASDFTSLGSVSVVATSTWAAEDFSDLSLSLPDDGSTVSFRIYGSGGTGTAGSGNWRVDDLAVTVVPEPSSIVLATFGGLACFFLLRRRH